MKRVNRSAIFCLTIILAILVSPTAAVFASNGSAQTGSVIASAVVVPAQVSRMGFIISAPVSEVTVREGDRVEAGQALIVLNTPELEYAVTAADAAYRSAEAYAELQRYKRVKDIRNGRIFWDVVHPEVRQRADAQAQQAFSALEIVQANLAENTLYAPYDGTVVSVNVIPGEFVSQGQAVLALATLDDMVIETTDLSERDVTKVRVGASADVFIEALNENFSGRVISVSPKADIVGGDVVFKVTVALDEQPQGLLWGMTAEVTIGE